MREAFYFSNEKLAILKKIHIMNMREILNWGKNLSVALAFLNRLD